MLEVVPFRTLNCFPTLISFEYRLCLDFSMPALQIAKSKLRDKVICVQGDITNVPLKSGTMDAITCNHVLYHVAAEQQKGALLELWRCLRPGGVAVVVYAWAWESALMTRGLLKVGNLVARQREVKSPPLPQIYYHAHSLKWFEITEVAIPLQDRHFPRRR